jgi:hypothetical protein
MKITHLIASIAVALTFDVNLPEALAANVRTATVPLKLIPIGNEQYKVGINIRLGGGPPKLYTFDTGSSGFYAAYNRQWWPHFKLLTRRPYNQSYGDSVVFESLAVQTAIGIPSNRGVLKAKVEVGLIADAWGGQLGTPGNSTWIPDIEKGNAPLFNNFYGDFGSGLRQVGGLFAVLPQLPGNLSSGFVVQLGCRDPSTHERKPVQKLMIGLIPKLRSGATSWVPMQKGQGHQSFPNGNPTYAQALLASQFSLSSSDKPSYAFATDAILDTGAPTTSIHAASDITIPDEYLVSPTRDNTHIQTGNTWTVTAEGTQTDHGFSLNLITGETPGVNEINVQKETTASAKSEVNLGLIPFFLNDVIFDIQRGLVGFAPSCSLGSSAKQ